MAKEKVTIPSVQLNAFGKLQDEFEDGKSVNLDFHRTGRAGQYDNKGQYAVWESADIQGLIDRLQIVLTATKEREAKE